MVKYHTSHGLVSTSVKRDAALRNAFQLHVFKAEVDSNFLEGAGLNNVLTVFV